MLSQKDKDNLKKWGVDADALVAAFNDPAEKPFAFEVKADTIKANYPTHSFMDEAELNGLKGRVKNEALTQAEELGMKAIKEKAGLTFDGKDPAKFLEALTTHLKLPVDEKLKEKERDIATLTTTLQQEKDAHANVLKQYKDRQELDGFSKLLPENKTKILRDGEIRSRYAEDGYTIGEYDDAGVKKPAIYKNGEVQKDKELKLLEPKAHLTEWMKTSNLLEVATPPPPGQRRSFDTPKGGPGGKSNFDHDSAYATALEAGGGKWNDKAQATYTDIMVKGTTATA